MSVAVKGVIWIVNLLGELQAPQPKVFGFLCGFTTAIYICNNLVFHETCLIGLSSSLRILSGLIKTLHLGISTQLAYV